ncbi:substrate-binding domain-containing protein [uncultured Victivallis sp.]|uniref:substrate-binding domain-containing protein n=1 Tax=uncultured Victivallis sp. TaxID=354118 RepID=UPI0025CD5949|nr:substrate-binding domain-containing protein [uncultured Victivallis sp.]
MNRKDLFQSAKRYVVTQIEEELKTAERKLPTARELAGLAGCSYGTMRLVMAELEREGFVYQRQGSGTYLTEQAGKLAESFLTRKLLYFRPPHFGTPKNSYNEFLTASLEAEAYRRNWKVTTVIVSSHDEFLATVSPIRGQYDAVAYAPVSDLFTLDQIAALRVLQEKPFVLFDDYLNTSIYSVTIDNRRGGAMAASLLLSQNHRKIGLLFGEPGIRPCQERAIGFSEILEFAGVKPVIIDAHVARDDNRYDRAYHAMQLALKRGLDITALFAISDYSAWGALDALKDAGKQVPGDVSLVSFDGLPFLDELKPRLTSIRQPMQEIMTRAFSILEGERPNGYQTILPPVFKPGESVKHLPEVAAPAVFRPLANRTGEYSI